MNEKTTKITPKKDTVAPAPAKTGQWDALTKLRSEMDRLFDDFSSGWPMAPFGRRGSMFPGMRDWSMGGLAVDIVDLDKSIEVRAEMPGMEEKDIDIELSGRTLTLKGEKKEEKEEGEKGGRYYMSERRYGSVQRTLQIPEGADCAKPDARFANGVLTVSFPKTKAAQEKAKKIKIKSG
jgi:HSP20 family protein